MEMTMKPMKPQERLYSYPQSSQICGQTACVGYLRADMGRDGAEFWSTWNNISSERKTDEFKAELDHVINALRFDKNFSGILKGRTPMFNYCRAHPEAGFGDDRAFGFRVDTEKYTYMLRLAPYPGEYNLYCYCYERRWLDRHMKNAERGIRFIDPCYKELFRIPDGDSVRIISADETLDRVCRYIDDYHVEVGNGLYHICEFAEMMERNDSAVIPLRSALPEQCYIYLPATQEIGVVKKGESGYCRSNLSPVCGQDGKAFAEELNRQSGVTKTQAEAMLAGSMVGWACPAADPKNYDENGKFINPKKQERGLER